MFLQGDMQCGSLSDDDEDDEGDYYSTDRNKTEDCNNVEKHVAGNEKSDSRAGSFNPAESCELCYTPSGIKDGKPSPWMWSRSTSFRSPDNPF